MTGHTRIRAEADYELVLLCKKGDLDAYEELVRRHQKKMLNIAYRMVSNYEEACEIVQDAFVSVYKNIRTFEGKARFSTWLYTIVMNISRNRLRQLRVQTTHEPYSLNKPILTDNGTISVEPASQEPSVLEKLERKDLQGKVQECINTLDEDFRGVLVLRDIQGFSYNEISDILNIADGTVKSRLFRAREAVKDCLKKVLGER